MTDRVYVTIQHAPGERWRADLAYNEQRGVEDHVAYWKQFFASGELHMGGPFPDGSGGLMVVSTDLERAREIASADPAVDSRLLDAIVREWRVVFSGSSSSGEGDVGLEPR